MSTPQPGARPGGPPGRAPGHRKAQRFRVKVKSPESLPLRRTAETRLPSAISFSTWPREIPKPSAISHTGRRGIRLANRTDTSMTSQSRWSDPPVSRRQALSQSREMRLRRCTPGSWSNSAVRSGSLSCIRSKSSDRTERTFTRSMIVSSVVSPQEMQRARSHVSRSLWCALTRNFLLARKRTDAQCAAREIHCSGGLTGCTTARPRLDDSVRQHRNDAQRWCSTGFRAVTRLAAHPVVHGRPRDESLPSPTISDRRPLFDSARGGHSH